MMFFRRIALALFVSSVAAESIGDLVSKIPTCAVQCIAPVVEYGHCNITTVPELASCLCPNVELQRRITSCFVDQLHTCPYDELLGSLDVATALCEGYPQESRQNYVFTTAIVLLAVVTPFMILRWISRWQLTQRLSWDDYSLAAAFIMLIAYLAVLIRITDLGHGLHLFNVAGANIIPILKLFYFIQLAYIFPQVLTKVSLLLFLLRIFPQRWFRIAVQLTLAAVVIHGLAFTGLIVFQCLPIHEFWDRGVDGVCLDERAITYAGAGVSIVEDFVILLLPLPCVKSLNVRIGQKISLVIMFSVGSLACVTSILRLKHLQHFGYLYDATWDDVGAAVWSAIENSCAVICACLPTLRPLVARMFPQLFENRRNSYLTAMTDTGGKVSPTRMDIMVSTEVEQRNAERSQSWREPTEGQEVWVWSPGVESTITGSRRFTN